METTDKIIGFLIFEKFSVPFNRGRVLLIPNTVFIGNTINELWKMYPHDKVYAVMDAKPTCIFSVTDRGSRAVVGYIVFEHDYDRHDAEIMSKSDILEMFNKHSVSNKDISDFKNRSIKDMVSDAYPKKLTNKTESQLKDLSSRSYVSWELHLIPKDKQTTENVICSLLNDPETIKFVDNPTKEMIEIALGLDNMVFKHIKNYDSDVSVMLNIVDVFPGAVLYMPYSTEEVILHALSKDGMLLAMFPNKSEQACLVAVKSNPMAIECIDNPSLGVSITAVSGDPRTLMYVKKQTESICLAALKKNHNVFNLIKKPTKNVCLYALHKDGDHIRNIKNPSSDMCRIAIKTTPTAIRHIKKPSEELKLMAVTEFGYALKFIENPSYEVCLAAAKNIFSSVVFIKDQAILSRVLSELSK